MLAWSLVALVAFAPSDMAYTGLAPNTDDCKTIDPLNWCLLRVTDAAATLEHMRTCADIAIIDEVQRAVGDANGMDMGTPLRKSIWKGFEDHVCVIRNKELVITAVETYM